MKNGKIIGVIVGVTAVSAIAYLAFRDVRISKDQIAYNRTGSDPSGRVTGTLRGEAAVTAMTNYRRVRAMGSRGPTSTMSDSPAPNPESTSDTTTGASGSTSSTRESRTRTGRIRS